MKIKREIFIGNVGIGGHHPVSIQSMTSTDTHDARAALAQIIEKRGQKEKRGQTRSPRIAVY